MDLKWPRVARRSNVGLVPPPFTNGLVDRPSDDLIDLKSWTLQNNIPVVTGHCQEIVSAHVNLHVSTCLFTWNHVQDQLVVNLLP